jgi:hypothetical protein
MADKPGKKDREIQIGIAFSDMLCRKLAAGSRLDEDGEDRRQIGNWLRVRWLLDKENSELNEERLETKNDVLSTMRSIGRDIVRDHNLPLDPARTTEHMERLWDERQTSLSVGTAMGLVGGATLNQGASSPAGDLLTGIGVLAVLDSSNDR